MVWAPEVVLTQGVLNPHLRSPTDPLLCERMRDPLHILFTPIAQHLSMRENPHFFELFSPTHLTSLAPSVTGDVEIKFLPVLVLAMVGVTWHGGMFCVQLEESFQMVYGSGGVCWVVRARSRCMCDSLVLGARGVDVPRQCLDVSIVLVGLDILLVLCYMMSINLEYMLNTP